MKNRSTPAFLLALFGVALGTIAYFAPFGNNGVDGSIGALLALIGAFATAAGLFLVMMVGLPTLMRRVIYLLIALAAGLTAIAAYFLMQSVFAIVMVLALLGLILALTTRSRRRTA